MNEQEIIAKYNINPDQQADTFYTWTWDFDLVWGEDEGNGYKVYRSGEMRAYYLDPQGEQHDLRYTEDFVEVGLDTDTKVAEATESGMLKWENNPWFEVCHDEWWLGMGDEIFGNITEAIARAIHLGSCNHPNFREDNSCEDCYYEGGN